MEYWVLRRKILDFNLLISETFFEIDLQRIAPGTSEEPSLFLKDRLSEFMDFLIHIGHSIDVNPESTLTRPEAKNWDKYIDDWSMKAGPQFELYYDNEIYEFMNQPQSEWERLAQIYPRRAILVPKLVANKQRTDVKNTSDATLSLKTRHLTVPQFDRSIRLTKAQVAILHFLSIAFSESQSRQYRFTELQKEIDDRQIPDSPSHNSFSKVFGKIIKDPAFQSLVDIDKTNEQCHLYRLKRKLEIINGN